MKKSNTLLIYGFPSVGKTTICKNNNKFLDLESSDYHWIYTNTEIASDIEGRKGSSDKILNPDWPENYYKAIKEALTSNQYDFVFVAFEGIVLAQKENIPYVRIYPEFNLKNEYAQRMRDRNNPEEFVEKIYQNWDKFILGCKEDYNQNCIAKIELSSGQYVLDIVDKLEQISNVRNFQESQETKKL